MSEELPAPSPSTGHNWFVYILLCADGTLYTGICTDIERRLTEHNGVGNQGARYTRSRRPVRLVYCEPAASRSTACVREAEIKRMNRADKLVLCAISNESPPR